MLLSSSSESDNRFMRFDGKTGGFTSKFVDTNKTQIVAPKIKANPINVQTGERSFWRCNSNRCKYDCWYISNYTQPLIDYNHEGLASF